VYAAPGDYFVYALNASTGSELWKHHSDIVFSSPSVYMGHVYVGSTDGYVCCLNSSTGDLIWQHQTQDCVDSSPAVSDGFVYVGSEDNSVYCLNASSGTEVWHASTGYWVRSSPAVAGGNVYVGSEDYSLYCFNASTGAKQWSYPVDNVVDSSPAIANGVLYVGSTDYRIYAFALSALPSEIVASKGSLALSTVVFDAIAIATVAMILFTLMRSINSDRKAKKVSEPISIPIKKTSWFASHIDALCILALLAFSIIFFVNLGSGPLWAPMNKRIRSGHTTCLGAETMWRHILLGNRQFGLGSRHFICGWSRFRTRL
jgi:hypothetical protein